MTSLTQHDLSILDKIKDPESQNTPLIVNDDLPRDPHVCDPEQYRQVTERERAIISSLEEAELQKVDASSTSFTPLLSKYFDCVKRFDELIQEYPNYASARNNRAQSLRRIYGDGMLVKTTSSQDDETPCLDPTATDDTLISASRTVLADLSAAISLLVPITPFAPLSPPAAKTLSQAHTQRGALYHITAKRLASKDAVLRIDESRQEARWKIVDFEENASDDFLGGGRYGNEVAKALAVRANPTAKLCGEMVKEAMKMEYTGETGV